MALGQYGAHSADPPGRSVDAAPHAVCVAAALAGTPDTTPDFPSGPGPLRIAAGMARHGARVATVTLLGRDPIGRRIAESLTASGIVLSANSFHDDPTTHHSTATANSPYLPDGDFPAARAIVVGGPACYASEDASAKVTRAVASSDRTLRMLAPAIPAGSVLTDDERIRLTRHVEACDVLVACEEDLEALAPGCDPLEWSEQAIAAVGGPALMIITAGSDGLIAMNSVSVQSVDNPEPLDDTPPASAARDVMAAACLHALTTTGCTGDKVGKLKPDSLKTLAACGVRAIDTLRPAKLPIQREPRRTRRPDLVPTPFQAAPRP